MTASSGFIYIGAASLCAGVAAFTDSRSRRIPNWLTGPGLLLGLVLHAALGGAGQAGLALCAGLLAGGTFFLFFMAGGMGAGDVKLMAAVGCLAGMHSIGSVMIATAMLGAVAALMVAAARGRMRETFSNAIALFAHHQAHGLAVHPEMNVRNNSMLRLPYAIPIAGGCLVTLMMGVQGAVTL